MGGIWLVEEDVGGRQETSNLLMVALWCQLPNMECMEPFSGGTTWRGVDIG